VDIFGVACGRAIERQQVSTANYANAIKTRAAQRTYAISRIMKSSKTNSRCRTVFFATSGLFRNSEEFSSEGVM